jgi:hypothetical protein
MGRYLLRAEEESESHVLLECPKRQRWREEILNNKRSHVKNEIALSKILTVKNATEQRHLGTFAY